MRSIPLTYGRAEVHATEPIALLVTSHWERCAVDLTPDQARRVAQELIRAAESAERQAIRADNSANG